jgi:sigma-70-like protein
MCELEGMSYKEIAAVMEMPIGTVMSALAFGRAQLRERLMRATRRNKMAREDHELLLQGCFDDELDLIPSAEFEEHVRTCPDCPQQLHDQQAMRPSWRAANLYDGPVRASKLESSLRFRARPSRNPSSRRAPRPQVACRRGCRRYRTFLGRTSDSEHRRSATNRFSCPGDSREPHPLAASGSPVRRAIYRPAP